MTTFNISNKVAIVTGGASGLGLQFVQKLLENGARGVTIADINPESGAQTASLLDTKYGVGKVLFVKTDIFNYESFDAAFKATIDTYGNVDILINNAGIYNDVLWKKEIDINIIGTLNGHLLALDQYISKYKSDKEGLIVNVSSVAGFAPFHSLPIYSATKFAVHGLTLAWGGPGHYARTNVRVIGICPGVTTTNTAVEGGVKVLDKAYTDLATVELETHSPQSPEEFSTQIVKIIERAPSGTMWVVEGGKDAYQFKIPDRFTTPKVYL